MKGISEISTESKTKEKSITPTSRRVRFRVSDRPLVHARAFNRVVPAAATAIGMEAIGVEVPQELSMKEYDPDLSSYGADLYVLPTNVLVEAPESDIRFMFESTEGIRLPDSTGEIRDELKKPQLDPQRINELIWEQAIVWPLTHFAFGVWTRPNVDLSQMNLALPPADFSWISQNR
jgi:hypothetical protein